MNWNNITLGKFQQIEEINSRLIPDIDRVLFSTCIVFDRTEFELDNTDPKKVVKMMSRMQKIFETPLNAKAYNKIGRYFINYDVSKMTFGQYIELAFFLLPNAKKEMDIQKAHYVMATISNQWLRKHTASDHRKKANYFLTQPVDKIIGSLKLIVESFGEFNKEYRSLFGVDKEVTGDVQEDAFNKRYGWIYSASQVAEYERITNDEAFALPVRQALNDLAYLKAKGKYDMEQLRKPNKSIA
jgi:hypothetical protein